MKEYTDLEQSKKLQEILPIETSDHHYVRQTHDFIGNHVDSKWSYPKYGRIDSKYARYIVQNFSSYETMPCWSLAALMEFLPYDVKGCDLAIYKSYSPNEKNFAYRLYYEGNLYDYGQEILMSTSSIELIDACVEMILKLHEKNLLNNESIH